MVLSVNNLMNQFPYFRRRAFFKEITILVPKTWSYKSEYEQLTLESHDKSDIVVDIPNKLLNHGDKPFVIKATPCGELGYYMHFTPQYLLDESVGLAFGPYEKVSVYFLTKLEDFNNSMKRSLISRINQSNGKWTTFPNRFGYNTINFIRRKQSKGISSQNSGRITTEAMVRLLLHRKSNCSREMLATPKNEWNKKNVYFLMKHTYIAVIMQAYSNL